MTKEEENNLPASLDEAKKIVEQEFLGTGGIHGVGKKASKNSVRVYASVASTALDSVLSDIKSRCAPFDIDVVIEEKPVAAPPPEETKAEHLRL
jgi:hypothetical protein